MANYPVTPNGKIILLSGIPMDRQHRHTVNFTDRTEQETILKTFKRHEFSACTYAEANKVYLEISRDDVIGCNYIMYQNTGFSNKWFYGFITETNYVNVDNTEIIFEIDYYQTFMFDFDLRHCFVEREHSATDAIGDNILPEQLEQGEFIQKDGLTPLISSTMYSDGQPLAIIILTRQQINYDTTNGYTVTSDASRFTEYNGVRSGLSYMVCLDHYDGRNGDALYYAATYTSMLINAGYADSIEAIYLVPQILLDIDSYAVDSNNFITGVRLKTTPKTSISNVNLNRDTGAFTYKGRSYTPKNNKLHTYPYKALYLTTLDGNYATYRYEDFYNSNTGNTDISFALRGDVSSETALMAIPENYKNDFGLNYDERLILTGFGTLSCASDVWRAYLAQHANMLEFQNIGNCIKTGIGASNIVAGAVSAYFGNPQGLSQMEKGGNQALGGIMGIIGQMKQIEDIKALPANAQGSRAPNSLTTIGRRNIYVSHLQIKPEFAEIIDNFFTMFGYACKQVKIPNLNSRTNWNYIKTIDCNIVPYPGTGMDANAVNEICAMFNNGVTIWHYIGIVGNYNLNNAPV